MKRVGFVSYLIGPSACDCISVEMYLHAWSEYEADVLYISAHVRIN